MKNTWRLAAISVVICLLLNLIGFVSPALADNGHAKNSEASSQAVQTDTGRGSNHEVPVKHQAGAGSESSTVGDNTPEVNTENGQSIEETVSEIPTSEGQGTESEIAAVPSDGDRNAESDHLLVKFVSGTSPTEMDGVHQRVGGKVKADIPEIGVQVVEVPRGEGAVKAAAYRQQKGVSYVEPDAIAQAVDMPNDPYFNSQWDMTKVLAPEAWDITQGSPDIRIAILDTGIDLDHPDLAAKIVSSVNFTSSPTADYNGYSHGTHVAGISAAVTSNGIGIAGLGRNCSLMNVKVLGDDGYGDYSWVAQGIIWAADNGANVINLSLGGSSPSTIMEDAVNYAWSKGAVVIAAAGNSGNEVPFYPAYYTNSIAVGATDSVDNLAGFSNRGSWVDVAAPGVSIYSTVPPQYNPAMYDYKSGTSMASPHVAGLAGLVFSVVTDTNGDGKLNDEVRSRIETSCELLGINVAYGRINAYQAVMGLTPTPTPAPAPTPTPAPPAPSPESMWVDKINLVPAGRDLLITVKVANPDPVKKARVTLELRFNRDGTLVSQFCGSTNTTGEVTFRWRRAAPETYLATVTGVTHNLYVWDNSKGVVSVTYMLGQ